MAKEDDHTSFTKLMALKETSTDVFEALTLAWPPGNIPSAGKRAFGGHVYAQAVWAASRTVGPDFHIHNVTGHFLLGGLVDVPFIYRVRRVRDGGMYCLRMVEVFQNSSATSSGKGPCFVSTVSFKRPETHDEGTEYGHQDAFRDHIQKRYDVVLRNKRIEDHPLAPRIDADWDFLSEGSWDVFPGLEMRKVDMRAYNGTPVKGGGPAGEAASHWRQLIFYRLKKDEVEHKDENDLNLHAAAHLYASDRNGIFLVLRALGYGTVPAMMGSLSHTVIFHGLPEAFRMLDERGQPKWFVQESWTTNSGENRVCHNSRIWNCDDGTIVATTMQDGMMRLINMDIIKEKL